MVASEDLAAIQGREANGAGPSLVAILSGSVVPHADSLPASTGGLDRRLSVLARHNQTGFVGDDDRLRAVTQTELVEHPADMGLHRLFGD